MNGRSLRSLALALALALAPGAAGCMETVVKPGGSKILTAEESAQKFAEQRLRRAKETSEKAEADDGKPKRPEDELPKPRTLEEEIVYYRTLAEKEPQNPRWHFELGWAYERKGDAKAGALGTAEPARVEYRLAAMRYGKGADVIEPKGSYTGPHLFLGRVLWKLRSYGEAARELEAAVEVKPADEEAYFRNPDYREAYWLLGVIHHDSGREKESRRAFRHFIAYGGERARVVDFYPDMIAED